MKNSLALCTVQTPTACGVAVPENYTPGSAAFGGVLRSHAEMTFDQKNINEKLVLLYYLM